MRADFAFGRLGGTMKTFLKLAVVFGALAALAGFWGCQVAGPTGTLRLSIADAAVDDPAIDGVWITIGEVQYNLGEDNSGWQSFGDFVGPAPVNLLDYQNGLAYLLGEVELPSGRYEQIRFLLDIPDEGVKTPPATPGCWVSFADGRPDAPLFVPSGLQTGYKALGSFQVPVNGVVSITADFDLHKALRLTNKGERYLLQPTIRLVVEDQAGAIAGEVLNAPPEQPIKVFAYADGTYLDTEDDLIPPDNLQFSGAVAGAAVDPANQCYRIAFLAPGVYDLVVATVEADTTLLWRGFVPNVTVVSEQTTHQEIDLEALDADTEPEPAP
jgi:hypothetical protein